MVVSKNSYTYTQYCTVYSSRAANQLICYQLNQLINLAPVPRGGVKEQLYTQYCTAAGSQSADLSSAESANKFSSCPTWWCQRTSCSSFNKTRLSDSTEMPIIYSIVGLHRTEMQSKQGSIKRYNMDVESHTKFWWQNNTIGFQSSLLNFSQLTPGPDLQLIVQK